MEKNYSGWSFHLRHFVDGKGLDEFLDGTTVKPEDKSIDERAKATWKQNNGKEVTWILGSIDPSIAITLPSFSTASEMWAHLKKLYHQSNKAREFHLDTEVAKYAQGDKTMQDPQFYRLKIRFMQ